MGELQFFPASTFDLRYYPYYGKLRHVSVTQDHIFFPLVFLALRSLKSRLVVSTPQVNYSAPIVAVRFAGIHYDVHLQIQCKLNGKGIVNNSPTDRYLGSVTFSMDVGA